MKVILTEKVKSLGGVGEIHNVSPGFARNFLLPKKFAKIADEGNEKALADQKKALAKKISAEKKDAQDLKTKLDGVSVTIEKKVGGTGRLFGTVTGNDLSKALLEQGLAVEKRQIIIETPIKQLGTFEIKAKLFSDVEAVFKVTVNKDAKQIEEDAKRAKAKREAPVIEAIAEEKTLGEAAEAAEAAKAAETTEEAKSEETDK